MSIALESLGLTRDQLTELVVERAANQLLMDVCADEDDGSEYKTSSRFAVAMKALVVKRIDAKVAELGEAFVLPQVAEMVENLTLQATNKWGEAKGAPVTFVEYLTERAEKYLVEPVDSGGRAKGEYNYSSYGKDQPRIAYMVNNHLQFSIQVAMEAAMKNANSAIVVGLEATIKQKLAEVAASLKVAVKS